MSGYLPLLSTYSAASLFSFPSSLLFTVPPPPRWVPYTILPADSALFGLAHTTRAMDIMSLLSPYSSPSYGHNFLDEPQISPTSEEGGVRRGRFIWDCKRFTIREDDNGDGETRIRMCQILRTEAPCRRPLLRAAD